MKYNDEVSTFAWYAATTSGSKTSAPDAVTGSVTVTEINKVMDPLTVDALDIGVQLATIPNSGKMELAYCYANDVLHTGYLDTAGIFHDLVSPVDANNVLSVQATVTISLKQTIIDNGYGTDTTDSSIRVPIQELITAINTQRWDLTAERTTLTSYAVASGYVAQTEYWYDNSGTMTKDETITSAETYATAANSHALYTKASNVANESKARFYLNNALTSARDTATSLAVDSNFGLGFVYNATPANATYSVQKTFNIYIYGGDHAAATVYTPDVKDLINGFSVTLAERN